MYDLLVFIGRFRPFTEAHQFVVREALKKSNRLLMVVGSCFSPRTPRNPWTFEEVTAMISASLTPEERERVSFAPIADYVYADHLWLKNVQEIVNDEIDKPDAKIGLIGHSKDQTSYYLKMFPMYDSINVENYRGINATAARNGYFSNISDEWTHAAEDMLPKAVIDFLVNWKKTEFYDDLIQDFDAVRKYHEEWGKGPYVTTDSVVVQAGHVLLIKRSGRPGKGLWALPGGFLDGDETLLGGAIRELHEETSLDVPKPILEKKLFVMAEAFGEPMRDPRARIITHAHLFDLTSELDRKAVGMKPGKPLRLTKIRAASDAAHAEWVPLGTLDQSTMFSDHFHIIRKMMSGLNS